LEVVKNELKMSQNSEVQYIPKSDMQLFLSAMKKLYEQLVESSKGDVEVVQDQQTEERRKQAEARQNFMAQGFKKLEDQLNGMEQDTIAVRIPQVQRNTDEKKERESEDVEGQMKINDNRQVETSMSVQEQIQVPEKRETKETDASSSMQISNETIDGNLEIQQTGAKLERRAAKNERRQGEREAPNEQNVDEKAAERTNSKPRKSHVKSLAAAGASRKKKFKLSKKKLEVLRKNMHGKSPKEVFQQWMDQVRKKPREQVNNMRRRETEVQRQVRWDP
jgi:hypothetical protein